MKKFIYLSAIISINVITFGGLFKIFHWPGANILLVFGMLFFALLVLPLAIFKLYNNQKDSLILYIVGFLCSFMFIIGALFKIMHWPGSGILLIISLPLPIILFLPVYYFYHKKSEQKNHQNLIGVMFLLVYYSLFSALMALNVSRNVLNNFVNNSVMLEARNLALNFNQTFKNTDSLNLNKAKQITYTSHELIFYIHNFKRDLISYVEVVQPGIADTLSSSDLLRIDNIDRTQAFLFGTEDINIKETKVRELKNQIELFKADITKIISNKNFHNMVNKLLDTSDQINLINEQKETWEVHSFNQLIFIACIYKLNSLESNVRIVELLALQSL